MVKFRYLPYSYTCIDRSKAFDTLFFMIVKRGRWAKPQIIYQERKCTLCGQLDVEDEYHVLLICLQYSGLRAKFIRKQFYVKPSMLKF